MCNSQQATDSAGGGKRHPKPVPSIWRFKTAISTSLSEIRGSIWCYYCYLTVLNANCEAGSEWNIKQLQSLPSGLQCT